MLSTTPRRRPPPRRRSTTGPLTGGPVTGSVTIDAGLGRRRLDPPPGPRDAATRPGRSARRLRRRPGPGKQASNFLVVDPSRSATGNSLGVMGPQLGYYYPEIVQQIHLTGPASRPRAWPCPGAVDVPAHRPHPGLRVEPHLGQPRRARRVRRAALQPRRLDARPATRRTTCSRACAGRSRRSTRARSTACRSRYPTSVHGPVIGTATVGRQADRAHPQALDVRAGRPEPRRAQGHDRGQGDDAEQVLRHRQPVRLHVQLGATCRGTTTAFFSSGLLPKRAAGPRPAPADARHRRVRVAGLPQPGRAPARHRRARAACC